MIASATSRVASARGVQERTCPGDRASIRSWDTASSSGSGSAGAPGLLRLGSTERELRTGADAVVDAVVAFGTPADVVRRVDAHRRAGADHVRLDPVAHDLDTALRQLEQVGDTLATSGADR